MNKTFSGVVTRLLGKGERGALTEEAQTPLVIESDVSKDPKFLRKFLETHSDEITEAIAVNGAVLLRGFDIASNQEFERQVLSIQGMRGINEVFMSEDGRTVVDGTNFVLHTNTLYKTGGSFRPVGGFHPENYYVPDVPRYISFFCNKPSWLGGETGLINFAGLYADLPEVLKEKLERQSFLVAEIAIENIARRYDLSHKEIEEFCVGAGLTLTERDGIKRAAIFKPSVVKHPVTNESVLLVNTAQLNGFGLAPALIRVFMTDYSRLCWLVHRVSWRYQWVGLLASALEEPRAALRIIHLLLANRRARQGGTTATSPSSELRIGQMFSVEEIQLLAQLMRKRFSSFLWKKGDILIVDNLKMAHTGMPGFGPRDLKAMICNPLPFPLGPGPGIYMPRAHETCETLGAQLIGLRGRTRQEEANVRPDVARAI